MLIFFTADGQSEMFRKLHSSLKKRGILVLGRAETPKEEGLFRCLSPAHHVFRKVAAVYPIKSDPGEGKNAV
jgi:chemotaxis methyl-accepting protein methylase